MLTRGREGDPWIDEPLKRRCTGCGDASRVPSAAGATFHEVDAHHVPLAPAFFHHLLAEVAVVDATVSFLGSSKALVSSSSVGVAGGVRTEMPYFSSWPEPVSRSLSDGEAGEIGLATDCGGSLCDAAAGSASRWSLPEPEVEAGYSG